MKIFQPIVTGSLNVSGSVTAFSFTGSLQGTATTASYALNAVSSSRAISASFASTASYVQNAQTASYVTLAQTASYVATAQTASYVLSSSYAISSSNASTASYVLNAVSSSFASTASYLNTLNQNLTFNGNLTLNGTASIAYLDVTYESASVIYSSGSNQFGDATNDTQTLIGRVIVSGSLEVTGSANIPSITGSLLGTASYASQALTASYITTAQTASYVLQAISASFATTASYASTYAPIFPYIGNATITGSIPLSGSISINNGTDLMKISRGSGALGRLIFSRPNNEAVESVSFGGGNEEIYIRSGSGKITHSGPEFQINNSTGATGLGLYASDGNLNLYGNSATNALRVFGTTRNILIQNGGVFTDAGFRLDVQGTSRFNGNSNITGSLTATSISSSAFNPTNITNNYFPVKSGSALVDSMLYQSVAGETLNWGSNTTPNSRAFAVRAANYPQVTLYNNANSYTFGMGPAGGFSFTNGSNNNKVIDLAQNASASIYIQDQNITTCFNGGNFGIGWTNAGTIPSKFYVLGNSTMSGSLTVSGSVMVTGGITGSLLGTASYATQALSASYTTTATTSATASYSTNFTVASTLIIDETLTDFAKVASTIVGSNNLFTQATGSYRSAFGKYTLFNGTNARSGEFISVLNGTNVRYYDSSTTDIGDTTDIVFSAAVVGSDLQINATAGSSGWTVRMLTTYL